MSKAIRAMMPIPSGTQIWVACGATDMRRGFDGLAMARRVSSIKSRGTLFPSLCPYAYVDSRNVSLMKAG
jgi:hypothetical protein